MYRTDAPDNNPRISEEALEKMMSYNWPGNVRELENTVHRAIILARDEVITPAHIVFTGAPGRTADAEEVADQLASGMTLKDIVAATERKAIEAALQQANGNRSQAAKQLGIYRRLLYAKMNEYGIAGA
jgi:DNA-binding NtrC family response regulator